MEWASHRRYLLKFKTCFILTTIDQFSYKTIKKLSLSKFQLSTLKKLFIKEVNVVGLEKDVIHISFLAIQWNMLDTTSIILIMIKPLSMNNISFCFLCYKRLQFSMKIYRDEEMKNKELICILALVLILKRLYCRIPIILLFPKWELTASSMCNLCNLST